MPPSVSTLRKKEYSRAPASIDGSQTARSVPFVAATAFVVHQAEAMPLVCQQNVATASGGSAMGLP